MSQIQAYQQKLKGSFHPQPNVSKTFIHLPNHYMPLSLRTATGTRPGGHEPMAIDSVCIVVNVTGVAGMNPDFSLVLRVLGVCASVGFMVVKILHAGHA